MTDVYAVRELPQDTIVGNICFFPSKDSWWCQLTTLMPISRSCDGVQCCGMKEMSTKASQLLPLQTNRQGKFEGPDLECQGDHAQQEVFRK